MRTQRIVLMKMNKCFLSVFIALFFLKSWIYLRTCPGYGSWPAWRPGGYGHTTWTGCSDIPKPQRSATGNRPAGQIPISVHVVKINFPYSQHCLYTCWVRKYKSKIKDVGKPSLLPHVFPNHHFATYTSWLSGCFFLVV